MGEVQGQPVPNDEVRRRFLSAQVDEQQRELIQQIREEYISLADKLEVSLPPGRHKSMALTDLETSCMLAIKAVSHG